MPDPAFGQQRQIIARTDVRTICRANDIAAHFLALINSGKLPLDTDHSFEKESMDSLITEIADYVHNTEIKSELAFETARYCLMDSLGCGFLALSHPGCTKLLGPLVPGGNIDGGCRVPGTNLSLDPVKAAFDIGTLVRWLDFNDTWLAAEWGHPSDNLGAILAVADWQSRYGNKELSMQDVLHAMIKAHEVQGILALDNSFNRVGLDHVLLVRIASTAVASYLLGNTLEQTQNAISNAWIDGGALRTYRHSPNTGSRKSWAAGDATSRAVRLAMIAGTGEMGYETALSAPNWGFSDVLFGGNPVTLARPLESYVMENVLFKISFPAEFHAQTAVECALQLHDEVKDRLDEIERVEMQTQEPGVRIIDKTGPLDNYADRDHCLQYMVAVGMIFGDVTADHYTDNIAKDPRIDALRAKMEVSENQEYTREYYDLDKRAIGNSVQVFFTDGSSTAPVEVIYPVGHRNRREEGIPLLIEKFKNSLPRVFSNEQITKILDACSDQNKLESVPVQDFMAMFVSSEKGMLLA